MKKSKQLIGIGIVELSTGKVIGKIKDTIFLPGSKYIAGFNAVQGKWVSTEKVLFAKDILHIGRDMVTVEDCNILCDIRDFPKFIDAKSQKNKIIGLKVITEMGEELGYLEDIIIDEKKLCIEGYVLTDGIIEDIFKGKTIIPFEDKMLFGEDVIVIKEHEKNMVFKNDISLKRIFKKGRRLRH